MFAGARNILRNVCGKTTHRWSKTLWSETGAKQMMEKSNTQKNMKKQDKQKWKRVDDCGQKS